MSSCVAGGAAVIVYITAQRHAAVVQNATMRVNESVQNLAHSSDPCVWLALGAFAMIAFIVLGAVISSDE